MEYPTYTTEDLSGFSGRPVASYTAYANTALSQALLLFKIGTCLAQFPDGGTQAELAKMGILAMADDISLKQEYQQAMASPFSSESIGSYSYSKRAQQVQDGDATGIMWFDLAIKELSMCDAGGDGIPTGGGVGMFEYDGTFVDSDGPETVRFLGPADLDASRGYGFDPSTRNRF